MDDRCIAECVFLSAKQLIKPTQIGIQYHFFLFEYYHNQFMGLAGSKRILCPGVGWSGDLPAELSICTGEFLRLICGGWRLVEVHGSNQAKGATQPVLR